MLNNRVSISRDEFERSKALYQQRNWEISERFVIKAAKKAKEEGLESNAFNPVGLDLDDYSYEEFLEEFEKFRSKRLVLLAITRDFKYPDESREVILDEDNLALANWYKAPQESEVFRICLPSWIQEDTT